MSFQPFHVSIIPHPLLLKFSPCFSQLLTFRPVPLSGSSMWKLLKLSLLLLHYPLIKALMLAGDGLQVCH